MTVILKNNAVSTLATPISASDTGIVVASGAQFPTLAGGDYFYATLVSPAGTTEIVKVTARVGNSMTVVRAQDGSSAASFTAGSLVEMRVNAASIRELRDEAAEVSIADAGGYYTSGTVEGALQEAATGLYYRHGASGSVARTVQGRLRDIVSVKDFGAVGDGVTDDTAAIQAAQQASKFVWVPPGDYVVTGLRIYDQVNLIGSGYENTRFLQGDPAQPAINCTSDASVGQLLSLRLENFGVRGHPSATVEAVKIEALGVYAIYRSHFDFIIGSCYQGLNMQASTANNVFYCTFKIDVVGTQTTAVVLNGGVYNTYDFFIAQVGGTGRMMQHDGFNNTFIRLVGDGTIFCSGQDITYISPTIEELHAATPSDDTGIYLNGFNQTLILPTIIFNPTNATKLTYCMRAFANSLIVNPRFLVSGVTPHPFQPLASGTTFTLQGPGQNECANKMEVEYTGIDASRDLRLVTKVGDVSSFISGASTFSGKSTQYLAPAAGSAINHRIFSSTDAMIFEPAGTVTLINMTIGYATAVFREGQTISVYTSAAITTINWAAGGADVSLFPASMTAGQTIQFVYRAANNKWYPIGT